jgi:hypothetical protein
MGQRRNHEGGLGQTSDQILGDNNIGDGPFDEMFHARPAALKQVYPSTPSGNKRMSRRIPHAGGRLCG